MTGATPANPTKHKTLVIEYQLTGNGPATISANAGDFIVKTP